MALARAWSVGLVGVDGHLVEVEADVSQGLPVLLLVGLPDAAVHEARDRIRAAIVNTGRDWPMRRITLALSPATLPKRGSAFDLALAAAVLAAGGQLPPTCLEGRVLLGELGLDGRLRPVRGILPAVVAAARAGIGEVVVPEANAAEAALVPEVRAYGVASLAEALDHLSGRSPRPAAMPAAADGCPAPGPDLSEVAGQSHARRALEIAAAGRHHLSLVGPPGSGKTMLAERLPGLLPPLSPDAALDVTAVHSVAGALPVSGGLLTRAPFQAPHHTASIAALVGGGSGLARPGALSLAHHGVLFLDEAPEFATGVLDALRQPLERGEIVLARSGGLTRYPSRVQLVLAANPCPCASPGGDRHCTCTAATRRRYLGRLSGPLLDRVDLHVPVYPVTRAVLALAEHAPEGSATVARRVAAARAAAGERLAGTGWTTNGDVPGHVLRSRWRLPRGRSVDLDTAMECGLLSARGYDRVLRVAWTIADLAGRAVPDRGDVGEALGLRCQQAVA